MSDHILYVIGVSPGGISGVSIIGAHELTIYKGKPGKISYFETFSVSGGHGAQALEIVDASREFHPRVLVCETFRSRQPITSQDRLAPVMVASRIEFCTETGYTICPFYWQAADVAFNTVSDEDLELCGLQPDKPDQERDATRHALAFIRRAKADTDLRDSAWGSEDYRFGNRKRGTARPVRRLYLSDGSNARTKAKMKFGHTGTRWGMTKPQMDTLRMLISDNIKEMLEWHHGCSGKSDEAGSYIAASHLIPLIVGHPGTGRPVGYWDELREAKDNLIRDGDIAREVDHLYATPYEDHEIIRSGTWSTVRRARKFRTSVTIIYRDGTYGPDEP